MRRLNAEFSCGADLSSRPAEECVRCEATRHHTDYAHLFLLHVRLEANEVSLCLILCSALTLHRVALSHITCCLIITEPPPI